MNEKVKPITTYTVAIDRFIVVVKTHCIVVLPVTALYLKMLGCLVRIKRGQSTTLQWINSAQNADHTWTNGNKRIFDQYYCRTWTLINFIPSGLSTLFLNMNFRVKGVPYSLTLITLFHFFINKKHNSSGLPLLLTIMILITLFTLLGLTWIDMNRNWIDIPHNTIAFLRLLSRTILLSWVSEVSFHTNSHHTLKQEATWSKAILSITDIVIWSLISSIGKDCVGLLSVLLTAHIPPSVYGSIGRCLFT